MIAVATAIFVATLDWNKAKGYLSAGVSKATGRQLRINGDLKVELGWITRVRAKPESTACLISAAGSGCRIS